MTEQIVGSENENASNTTWRNFDVSNMRSALFSFAASFWFKALPPGFSTSVWWPASHGFGKKLHALRAFALIVSAHPYCARNSLPRHALSARAIGEMWRYTALVGTLVSMHGFNSLKVAPYSFSSVSTDKYTKLFWWFSGHRFTFH